ncbi:EAL domain-containing protein [Caballeronia sp. GACF4]|uniref:putative bifunctional diguanylate cyclase/phosphodiesterase n=1 Tax=Caballeronia sp. GACF4 TaxID=2921763 RepID=UPI0020291360|nr:EAL domain-containing protein [Caballeronia sp. GACF4]
MALSLGKIKSVASIPRNNPELLIEQYKVLSYQVPLMYLILLINTWALAVTHLYCAPSWMTRLAPSVLTLICIGRIAIWMTSVGKVPDAQLAYRALRRTNRLASIIAPAFTGWALALFSYGDAYAKAHVAFYMAITVIGVIFCLMHVRSAAITVTIIVNGAFVIFFALSDNPVFVAIAINTALVCIAMLAVLFVHYRDFTRMVEARTENFQLANHDSLTGLPNRRAFFSALDRAFSNANVRGARLGLGVIDLDGFKPVNDLYGHPMGDKLLASVGQRLSDTCGKHVYLSRLGGDEFSLILSDVGTDAAVLDFGNRICDALRQPFMLGDLRVQIGGTIGFAVFPEMAPDASKLFEYADYALYYAKQNRRGTPALFSADHQATIFSDASIEQALHLADVETELAVVYQPIVDIQTQVTVGFEALARWTSPKLGQVAPSRFIPVAERAGIVSNLTRTLLKKALTETATWPLALRLSFNLSAYDLSSDLETTEIVRIIGVSGVDPARIDFEITETAFIQELAFERVQKAATALRKLGCGVSLDDFGTGYSSLSYLHALPLTKIKIDRSFVTQLHRNPASYKIVKSLFALSKDMGLDCIVEGVETHEELTALRPLGEVFVQGYYYAKPMRATEIDQFLKTTLVSTPKVA